MLPLKQRKCHTPYIQNQLVQFISFFRLLLISNEERALDTGQYSMSKKNNDC